MSCVRCVREIRREDEAVKPPTDSSWWFVLEERVSDGDRQAEVGECDGVGESE